MWAALRSEPMVAKSVAAEVIISGAAITYDISHLRHPSSSVCLLRLVCVVDLHVALLPVPFVGVPSPGMDLIIELGTAPTTPR